MNTTEANIEIKRQGDTLISLSVIMPTWNKIEYDNTLSVNIPLFGIKTFARNEDDANIAIEEAIKCFAISSEKFGQGLETELQALGWTVVASDNNNILLDYNVPDNNFVLEQIMQTGEPYAYTNLEIA